MNHQLLVLAMAVLWWNMEDTSEVPTIVSWRTLYTSEFQELFANVTKIIKAKIINETKSYPVILKSANVSPNFPLDVVGGERMGGVPFREVSASSPAAFSHLSSLLELQTLPYRDPEARPSAFLRLYHAPSSPSQSQAEVSSALMSPFELAHRPSCI